MFLVTPEGSLLCYVPSNIDAHALDRLIFLVEIDLFSLEKEHIDP